MPLLLDPPVASSSPGGEHSPGVALLGANRLGNTLWHAGATAVLFALIGLVYYPSLEHVPRSDHWCFLVDTIEQDSFPALLASTYSYNRTRKVSPGDYQLFRPMLFALLSAEKAMFGNRFALWQAVGIGLHCLAVGLFLRILLLMNRMGAPVQSSNQSADGYFTERRMQLWLAYGFALFFGLNFAVVEMVIWTHINGYLLFIVLALAAMLLSMKILTDPTAGPAWQQLRLAGAFLLLLASAFTYEVGQFFALAVGIVVAAAAWRNGRLRQGLALFALFASILLLYQGANFLDKAAHPVAADPTLPAVVEQAASMRTLQHAGRYVLYATLQPFFPARVTWWYMGRVEIAEPTVSWEYFAPGDAMTTASLTALGALLVLTLLGFVRSVTAKDRGARTLLLLSLPTSLFILHLAVTVLGRMNLHPFQSLFTISSYYAYPPLLCFLIVLYGALAGPASESWRRGSLLIVLVLTTLLTALVVVSAGSGKKVYEINVALKKADRILRGPARTVKELIRAHGNEPGFSFAFDGSVCDGIGKSHGIPGLIVLFKRHVNNYNPTYLFSIQNAQLVAKKYEAAGSPGQPCLPQLFPDLVCIGTEYNFFYFDGWYYGVPYRDGYYRPEREQYSRLIMDRTLEGAQLRAEGKLAEPEPDCPGEEECIP